jgi:hypothetical protein
MTVAELEQALTALPGIGAPDYADGGMLQSAGGADRAARTRPGYKLVELVRIYESGSEPRAPSP